MNKKGFTLLEIAIVLVIIGLIMGMAMKGRSLIEAATIQKEMNKINKIEAAYVSFQAKHNRRPGSIAASPDIVPNTSQAIYADLISDGILFENDFAIDLSQGYWNFAGCFPFMEQYAYRSIAKAPGICIQASATIKPQDIIETGEDQFNYGLGMSQYLACYIEKKLDDENVTTGAGRGYIGEDVDFNNCDKLSDVPGGQSLKPYLYRIG